MDVLNVVKRKVEIEALLCHHKQKIHEFSDKMSRYSEGMTDTEIVNFHKIEHSINIINELLLEKHKLSKQ